MTDQRSPRWYNDKWWLWTWTNNEQTIHCMQCFIMLCWWDHV